MITSCPACGRPVRHTRHPVPGALKHQAHGLCSGCYSRSRYRYHYVPTPPDEAVILRLTWGERLHARPVERRHAVALLTRRGWSARRIAETIHCSPRTVQRHRTQLERTHAA